MLLTSRTRDPRNLSKGIEANLAEASADHDPAIKGLMDNSEHATAGHLVRGKTVAVVGGAMGGLAFAIALRKLGLEAGVHPMPTIRVFERDKSAAERANRGYSMSVRSDSGGLQAVKRLGALEPIWTHREPGPSMHISRHNFRPLWKMKELPVPGLPTPRIRITRGHLRKALLDQLNPATIHFGKTAVSAEPSSGPGGKAKLHFEDGSIEEFDLVVAADGASSRLRQALLPQEKLHYTGICSVAGTTQHLQPVPKELEMGQWLVMGPHGVALFLAVMNQDQAIWSLSFEAPECRAAELNALFRHPQAAQAYLSEEVRRLARGFQEPLPGLIVATEASSLWAFNARDLMPHANDVPGVVFIGDAWHAMSPFSGNGANMAMRDGLELAEHLLDPRYATLHDAVTAFAAQAAPRIGSAKRVA
ncbi:hypothetical protein WJX72_007195 [[Myrmecia] bisecta]|uniref:FAD-binding domain-containing protein n=1 Tax=[Myrmecia] bisecta TaxID=41462 RepID=A0AAW1QR60_9CHLO